MRRNGENGRRIDETGTREPSITRQGADRIVVQAPGESDPAQLERVIGQTAQLTVDALSLDDKALGTLHLKARNSGQAWLLESLRLSNPDGELSANGRWTRTWPPRSTESIIPICSINSARSPQGG